MSLAVKTKFNIVHFLLIINNILYPNPVRDFEHSKQFYLVVNYCRKLFLRHWLMLELFILLKYLSDPVESRNIRTSTLDWFYEPIVSLDKLHHPICTHPFAIFLPSLIPLLYQYQPNYNLSINHDLSSLSSRVSILKFPEKLQTEYYIQFQSH